MTGFDFHPEALTDLDEIWDFIAVDNHHSRYSRGIGIANGRSEECPGRRVGVEARPSGARTPEPSCRHEGWR